MQQTQDSVEKFCHKLRAGKDALLTEEFMIIARIESLILEQGMEDVMKCAEAYVEAGADAIMIHSRKKDPTEIFKFCEMFRVKEQTTSLVVVPTSFNMVTEEKWIDHGV